MKNTTTLKFPFVFMIMAIILLVITPPFISSARTQRKTPNKGGNNNNNADDPAGMGGPFGPGSGIPGFQGEPWGSGFGGGGGGYGFGFGGPSGGYSEGGMIRPTVVCKQKGPCYKKKLTCPTKCFASYSHSGKRYGAGGGGGGCTVDCEKNCVADC